MKVKKHYRVDGAVFYYCDIESMNDRDINDFNIWNKYIHRYDGPAIVGNQFWKHNPTKERWYLYNHRINEKVYLSWLDTMGIDINNLTPEDILVIDLKWKEAAENKNNAIRVIDYD